MKRFLPFILIAPLFLSACVNLQKDGLLITNKYADSKHISLGKLRPIQDIDLGFEKKVETGKIAASYGNLSYTYINSNRDVPLVVYCGGNSFRQDKAGGYYMPALSKIGDVFIFDYPGLGQSDGDATKSQFDEALRLLNNKINNIKSQRANKAVIYYGLSFGGGVCSDFAGKNPDSNGAILAGTFANYSDVAHGRYPIIASFVHLNIAKDAPEFKIPQALANYSKPIIIIATKQDKTIPFNTSKKLHERLVKQGNKTSFIELQNAEHSRIPADDELAPKLDSELKRLNVK